MAGVPSAQLLDYDSAALLGRYSPETIRRYCEMGILRRGDRWNIRQYFCGKLRRRIRLLTAAGVAALLDRRYTSPNGSSPNHRAARGREA